MAVAMDFIPFATCKIRHEDRFAAIFDGSCRQVTDAGPLGRIINRRRLHVRKDGKPVTSAQVYAVVMRYPDTFVKAEGRIMLMI